MKRSRMTLPLTLLATGLVAAFALVTGEPAHSAASSCRDRDGDGFGRGCSRGDDCNDDRASMHPGAVELCDLIDNDCNALVDDNPACPTPDSGAARLPVDAAIFSMGSSDGAADELPVHSVQLGAFALDRTEVSNTRYGACVDAGACTPPALSNSRKRPSYFADPAFADYPVIFVSWGQADTYCRYTGGRLPTEAEWERAARGPAPSMRRYPWGDDAPDCAHANFGGPSSCIGDTDAIGRRPLGTSPVGAVDMAGNVWEWVADWYDAGYYADSPRRQPQGPDRGTLKVMRGGCWESGASSLRVSCRKAELPRAWGDNVGFRCAYDVDGGAR